MKTIILVISVFFSGILYLYGQGSINNGFNPTTRGESAHNDYIQTGKEWRAEKKALDCDAEELVLRRALAMQAYDTADFDHKTMSLQNLGSTHCTENISFLEKVIKTDTSELMRCIAIRSLGWIGSDASVPFLLERVNDPKVSDYEKVCIGTFFAVIEHYKEAEAVLNKYCFTTEKRFCDKCIWAFYMLWNTSAVEYYRYLYRKSTDTGQRGYAILMLAKLGDKSTVLPKILKDMKSSDEKFRRSAIVTLRYLDNGPRVIRKIRQLEKDTSSMVRKEASSFLKEFDSKKNNSKSLKEPTVKAFSSAIYDPNKAVAYADKWWNGINSEDPNTEGGPYNDYSEWGGDCAAFVSQCLRAGGLDLSAGTDGKGAYVK